MGFDMASDGNGHKSLNCVYSGAAMKPLSSAAAPAQQHAEAAGGVAVAAPPAPAASAGSGPSSQASYSNLFMNGQEVFKFAVRTVPSVIDSALADAGIAKEQVDWLVMHQVCAVGNICHCVIAL